MGFCSQLWLLMWKNVLLQKRKVLVTVFEIMLPLFFASILLLIRLASPPIPFKNNTIFDTSPLTESTSLRFVATLVELGFTPETTLTKRIIGTLQRRLDTASNIQSLVYLNKKSTFVPKGFKSESDTVNYYKNHRDNLTVAIVFKGLDTATVLPTNVKYYIRPKSPENMEWFTKINYPTYTTEVPRLNGSKSNYFEQGILSLHVFLAEAFLEEWGKNVSLNISMHRMPYPPYVQDSIVNLLQVQMPLFLILSFVLSVIQYTKVIVDEKEQRLKESMKLMGLLPSAHWASWFIMFFIYLAITTGIYAYILCANIFESSGPVVSNADPYLFYVFLLIYSVAIITFCFMISVFVQKANVGAALSGILYFFCYLPNFYFEEHYAEFTYKQRMLACLNFNQAMAFGAKVIGLFEGTSEGIQWDNLGTPPSTDDNFSLKDSFQMMLIDSAIHLVITWYFDNVFPGEFGVPQPFYFFLTASYWLGISSTKSAAKATIKESKYFEREPTDLIAGIRIVDLYKEFSADKVAVNHLSLNMYEGQITVLLGHNGAGKTTTMSMLTGFIPATSGTAYIYDKDINTEISTIRKSLGLCPQHDILFKTLTVEEHLKFFAKLKGCPSGKLKEEVDTMIKEVGLEAKRNSASHTLSGGQKRKLGVAIALIYGSKVVILDEPSSGMDPTARRQTWEVLQNNRAGRTVLLTTHYMDEADVLGDRIAIMAEGVAKCCGTSLFLKKLYGAGYRLVVVKGENCICFDITDLVSATIPGAEFETETNTEVTYILPDDQSARFARLFRRLEEDKEELGIINFGVSATTMEEVFLKVGEVHHEENVASDNVNQSMSTISGNTSDDDITSGSEVTEKSSSSSSDNQLEHAKPKKAPHAVIAVPNSDILAFAKGYEKLTGFQLQLSQLHGILVKKAINVWRNWMLTTAQLLLPVLMITVTLYAASDSPTISGEPVRDFKLDDLGETIVPYGTVGSPSTTADKVVSNYLGLIGSAHTKTKVDLGQQTMDDYILGRAKAMGLGQYNMKILVGAQFKELSGQDVAATVLYNGQPYHTEPIGLAMGLNALIKHYAGSSVNIDSGLHPLPRNEQIDAKESFQEKGLIGFAMGFFICLGMAFFTASIVYFPISERTSGAKHLQVVSGIGHVVFWVGSFLCDYVIFMLMLVLVVIVFLIFDNPAFNDQLGLIALLINTFALVILPFTYFVHFFFDSAPSGLVVLIMYNLFSGFIPMIVMFSIGLISDLKEYENTLNILFPLAFPNYGMGASIVDIYKNYHNIKFCVDTINYKVVCLHRTTPCCKGYGKGCPSKGVCFPFSEDYGRWEEPGVGRYLAFMVLQGLIFTVLTFLMEYHVHETLMESLCVLCSPKPKLLDDALEDDDVAAERKRINTTPIDVLIKKESLLLVNLYKQYGSFVAVNQSCIGIPENECFGLLGTNGAGKTTTFKMLTGDVRLTSGNAYLNGFDIKTNIKKVQDIMGYCPQFDALIDQMTGRETLFMYARLRGVPAPNIPNCVNCLSDVLTLSPHMDKPSKTYSGGNKRKLSVGIALIGNPAFVLLDEPSSGMDPAARRQMWTVLSQVRQTGKTLILTSHSMEECEALCTRIVIMVRGRFVCLGSTQHLKSKFGQGYTLEAKMATSEDGSFAPNDVLVKYIKDNFPSSKLFDEHEGYVHMQILDPNVHLADVFDAMEKTKLNLNVQDYNVHQTSLEQVFLAFTKL